MFERIFRLGGRSRRGRVVALATTSLLAVSLLPASSSSAGTAPTGTPSARVSSAGAGPAEAAPAGLAGGKPVEVTLITGDTVTFTDGGEGGLTFDVAPARRGDNRKVSFRGEGDAENFYVFPSDAETYVNIGVLDRELFNVAALAEQGFADGKAGKDSVPAIVTFDGKRSKAELKRDADALPATSDPMASSSIQGAGVKVAKGKAHKFWAELTGKRDKRGKPSFGRGVDRVLLDQMYEVDLDESVGQVGAPQAWEAGFTGDGVTVAVIDTGVDATHPDLEGQVVASENFTPESDVTDNHGHGTHVASTIAGTGAASDGQYTGVAPDAEVLAAKVCNGQGQCQTSWIIAGMEWATAQGADVGNISLGGEPTDGTDLLSQTLNDLTEATDTLFVTSAGNSGGSRFSPHRVGSPGSADAALTVGAVDKSDVLARFSSRGPRVGDFAIKPEITAPGVDITAARATGTSMGTPANDHYTAASGTSMAAPHVTGAAVLLAQARPDLDATALKDTLASTALDGGYQPFEQGTGRLDIGSALDGAVYGQASVGFGDLDDADGPVEQTLTYTNTTDTAVTLQLGSTLTNIRSGEAAEGLSLSADTVTVPANGQASVTVTADAAASGRGMFNGVITATAEGISLRTGVGFGHIGQHTVTIDVLDHDGQPVCDECVGTVDLFYDTYDEASGIGQLRYGFGIEDGVASGPVPTGTYSLFATVWDGPPSESDRATMLIELEVVVEDDTAITLDARDTVLMDKPEVPDKDTQTRAHVITLCHEKPANFGFFCYAMNDRSGNENMGTRATDVYVTPAPEGELRQTYLWERWILAEPQPLEPTPNMSFNPRFYSPAPDYVYQVPLLYNHGIAAEDLQDREFSRKEFVEVPVSYHADQPDALIVTTQWPLAPYGGIFALPWVIHEPGEVTEYYLADDRFIWDRTDWLRYVPEPGMSEFPLIMHAYDAFPASEAGNRRETEHRFEAPHRHGVAEANQQFWEVARSDDFPVWWGAVIRASMTRGGTGGTEFFPPWFHTDNSGLHREGAAGGPFAFDTSWRMWNDDTGIELDLRGGSIPVFQGLDPEAATYRLEQTDAYPEWMAPYFLTKPTATTTWTFDSQYSDAEIPPEYQCVQLGGTVCQIQPLIQLRHELGLDVDNRAPAGRMHSFAIEAAHHVEAIDAAEVTEVTVQASFDDGETWEEVSAIPQPGQAGEEGMFQFQILHPQLGDTNGYVALRVQATDANGGTVHQTIERAYILKKGTTPAGGPR